MNPNHIGTNFDDFLKEEGIIMDYRFKFRIWNGTEMHYNDFVVTATGFVGKITEEFLGKCVFNQEDLTLDKECILMQCTGLKDKNGKLIYEGDICRNSKSGEVFNVVWHNPLASFCWQKHEHSHIYSYGELFRAFDYYEVIGNIYENKELLNDR
jgi:hypothetical protein